MSSSQRSMCAVPPCPGVLLGAPPWPTSQQQPAPASGNGAWTAWQPPPVSAQDTAQDTVLDTAQQRLSRLVSTLHRDIIPRLVSAHTGLPHDSALGAAGVASTAVVELGVDAFTTLVLERDDAAMDAHVDGLRNAGVDHLRLLSELLAPTARRLGELWTDDRCHFVDVTIGLGRLQQIMRCLSSAYGADIDPPSNGRRVLLMPAPGEQHTLGLSMVAEFFSRAGWDVAGIFGPEFADVERKVKYEWFDLIGISAGSEARLDAIRQCIATVRRLSQNRSVALLVGGPLFMGRPDVVAQVGADGSVDDGLQAPVLAEQLLSRRVRARERAA